MNKIIRIYNDSGCSKLCIYYLCKSLKISKKKVNFIDHKELIESNWEENTSILIIPGGRDIPYFELLKGVGCKKIYNYVSNGGKYIGICAGAYFACNFIEFEKGTPNEVLSYRDLNFFYGKAVGSIYPNYTPTANYGAYAVPIEFYDNFCKNIKIYFNGGCTFKYFDDTFLTNETNIKVIARYEEIKCKPPAIIKIKIGKGIVILSGVHFEISHSMLVNTKIINDLIPFENERIELFNKLINLS